MGIAIAYRSFLAHFYIPGSTSGKYTFYIAENRYNHGGTTGIYPDTDWKDTDLYDNYKQQYKPKLATGGQGKPTYITLTGTYTDYRSTQWSVNYTVYLGKNNYDNFHIDRNSEYINKITIKGLRNNDDYGEGDVWFDHRVDVTGLKTQKSAADCVTITRETLIDSHIEVRPLRVKWGTSMVNGEEVEEYDGVRLYLPTDKEGNLINWIGIEKFTGDNCQDGATYCFNVDPSTGTSFSTGKRKYFTTDLINQLQNMSGDLGVKTDANGRKFLDMYNGHCAWIYFDENTTSDDRPAEIKLDFYVGDEVLETELYIIKQRGLQTIGNYVVESYEEYLHSYDSVDKYNLSTSPVDYTQQGLAWGLVNQRISEDILVTTLANLGDWTPQRYDYFHSADGSNYNTYSNLSLLPDNPKRFGTGIIFTDRASAKKKISIKDMGTIPSSAYQYCLSKNKFNEDPDGNHTLDIHWYLPDVYELQNVLQASISDNASVDFRPDANYWSSQPAFAGTTYIDENDSEARAVSIKGITPVSRSIQNRIRCFYSKNAINVDMKERIPDGLGGNYLFIMKGKQSDGYFKNLLEGKKKDYPGVIETDYLYNDSSFPYPTKDNSYGASNPEFEYKVDKNKNNETIEGFTVNPQENWKKQVFNFGTLFGSQIIYETEYYTTLATYPGLTDKTLEKMGASIFDEKRTFLGIEYTYRDLAELANIDLDAFLLIEAYRPTDTTPPSYITDTQTLTSSSVIDLRAEELPQGESLKPLNDKLKISFGAANSQGNKPDFEYYELVSKTEQTNIRYWNPPVYTGTTHELNPESESFSQTGSGSETGVSTGTSSLQQASTNDAKQVAFDGTRNVSTLTHVVDGAYPKAKKDAEVKLDEILKNYPTSDGWVHGRYEYTPLSWNQEVPNIQWSEPKIETKKGLFSTYTSKVTITCTVTVTATVAITKPGSKTLYLQTTGTGCWGDPIPGEPVPAGSGVTSDELRIYSGNSFTISCTDPKYEITKVRVYFSGSNQIEDGNQDDYFARFVDDRIDLSTPITGDESSHLFGMEYNEADGWHQWSGSGRQSVTLNLADYKLTTNYDLGNMTWEDFFGGNWGAAVTYNYEYSAASKNLNKYIVVDRIEVKCTPKANEATE